MRGVPLKDGYGPTLPTLVRRWQGGWLKVAVLTVSGLVVLLIAGLLLLNLRDSVPVTVGSSLRTVSVEDPVAFTTKYSDALAKVEPEGRQVLRLEGEREGEAIQSFAVSPVTLPEYSGDISFGLLPTFSDRLQSEFAAGLNSPELAGQGSDWVNGSIGYSYMYRAKSDDGKTLYARYTVFPNPEVRSEALAVEVVVSAEQSGISSPFLVAEEGAAKVPYQSLTFDQ